MIQRINYDNKFDTLYVWLSDGRNSYGDDSKAGIILLRDIDTDHITGFTILHFIKKYKNSDLPELPKEVHCSIKNDVLPHILH